MLMSALPTLARTAAPVRMMLGLSPVRAQLVSVVRDVK
jgi:hypothetical protein